MKKITAFFIICILVMSMLSGSVLAEEDYSDPLFDIVETDETKEIFVDSEEVENSQDTVIVQDNVGDNDELLMEYMEITVEISDEPLNSSLSRNRLSEIECKVYDMLKSHIKEVADGKRNSTIFNISLNELGLTIPYTAADLGVEAVMDGGEITEMGYSALQSKLDQINSYMIIQSLLFDCPYDLYWYEKVKGADNEYQVNIGGRFDEDLQDYVIYFTDDSSIKYSFTVAQEYAIDNAVGTYEVDEEIIESVQTAITNVQRIIDKYVNEDDYQKLLSYKNEICNYVEYNFEAAADSDTPYGNPWQIIWVFDGNPLTNVVCEGYAKAFQFLCDGSDFINGQIESRIVTGAMTGGTGEGGHMWNVVTMDDGNNYLVDVTNCDTDSIGTPDQLFLACCKDGSPDEGYSFQCESGTIHYTYYDYIFELFSYEELEIANSSYGKTITVGDYIYVISGSNALLKKYTGSDKSVNIPESVNGIPVTMIGQEAFDSNPTIEEVIIPNTVRMIEDGYTYPDWSSPTTKYIHVGAFANCDSLKTVTFSEGSPLKDTGCFSFARCKELTTVQLPEQLEMLNQSCFEDCVKLAEIDIPETAIYIEQNSLYNTKTTFVKGNFMYFH